MLRYKNGLFIFHRDLRIIDNKALLKACNTCDNVYLIFIFTPDQVTDQNDYKSNNAVQFMIESLIDLKKNIKKKGGSLFTFFNYQENVITEFIKNENIEAVFFNTDYTPYAIKRDTNARNLCKKLNIDCIEEQDYYLLEPGSVISKSGGIYKKFTPFYENVVNKIYEKPSSQSVKNLSNKIPNIKNKITLEKAMQKFTTINKNILVNGGRKNGYKRLKKSLLEQSRYKETRNNLTSKTSFLSAYIKFGCISIREVYHAYKDKYDKNHGLISELFWREFFAHLLYVYPDVISKSYNKKLQKIKWRISKSAFKKWCEGKTGFPVVDAGMRQMNESGYMHNRVRMIVADFLVKVLLLDWRLGEKYFAKKLTDYDIASNNGNWQNMSSTGVIATPYFRSFNPFLQSEKFDKNCEYIKKWVPELNDVLPEDIHNWDIMCKDPNYKHIKYICPIVDYSKQKSDMLKLYKEYMK
jgi:deoxyribodipyrimidine photo-lyase